MQNFTKLIWLLITLLLVSNVSGENLGPSSKLYITIWCNKGMATLQGTNILNTWSTRGYREISIAVTDTIKTFGHHNGNYGAEYTLDGSFTGSTYTKGTGGGTYTHDGTTDGQYFYTADYGSSQGAVYKYSQDWQNPELLFYSGVGSEVGITYDPLNDSFWLGNWGGGQLRNYDRQGNLINSFRTDLNGHTHIGALAFDPADNTLWFSNYRTSTFAQYSRSGQYLGSHSYNDLSQAIYGAEFAFNNIPEPSTVFTIILALCAGIGYSKKFA